MRGELQISAAHRTNRKSMPDHVVAEMTPVEFEIVALFCALGLLLSFYVIHFFPDFGALVGSLEIACAP